MPAPPASTVRQGGAQRAVWAQVQPPPRRKKRLRLKTIALVMPVAKRSSTKLSTIDEVMSTSSLYQAVPNFQRVQTTCDYASGVRASGPGAGASATASRSRARRVVPGGGSRLAPLCLARAWLFSRAGDTRPCASAASPGLSPAGPCHCLCPRGSPALPQPQHLCPHKSGCLRVLAQGRAWMKSKQGLPVLQK